MKTHALTKAKAQMQADPFMCAIWGISEAALAPDRWPAALQSITEAVGASGGNYVFLNKRTGNIEWVSSAGLSTEVNRYVNYYAARDPYRPILEAASRGSWVLVSKCLPETFLRRDEWYNDFLLKAGIRDVAGARLFETASYTVLFGVMHGIYQAPPSAVGAVRLQELFEPLSSAARLHAELRELGWKSAAAVRALDQLARGVIITDGHGGVTEVNRAAEQILRRDDGLTVRQGKLCAERVFENDKLAWFIALAADGKTPAAVRQMLVGRRGGRVPYVLTVVPLGIELAAYERPLAMILIADPDARAPPERDLAELFGLSPAESRLTVALLAGKTMREVATNSGVQITTLRTQLSSVLRKVGVSRQAELIRVLANIPVVPLSLPEQE
jgi:DNA-binding CsgD family transcriptional regulator/PAS domain-containing protein